MKCSVKVDENMQKELNNELKNKSKIMVIVGVIGFVLYIALSLFFENSYVDLVLWISAFIFGVGLVLLFTVNKTNKNSVERNLVDEIELFEDHLIENIKKNEEVIATNKHYYKDIIKVKETENYLFLYVNKAAAVPIIKSAFTKDELVNIKILVNSAKAK